MSKNKNEWWSEGVKFQCQGSGNCCVSRGEYGFVFMTLKDRQVMAKELKLTTQKFTKRYCDKFHGAFHLKEDPKRAECMFLKDNKCSIYKGRPTQCRTWPFWPEVMSAKAWKKEVVAFCPGVGKGQKIPAATIQKNITEQAQSEKELI